MTDAVLGSLREILGKGQVRDDEESKREYARDKTLMSRECTADAVFFPSNAQEVSAVAALANRHRIPLVPGAQAAGFRAAAHPCMEELSCRSNGWTPFWSTIQRIERLQWNLEDDIWNVRKALAEADHLYGSVEAVGEDVVVPCAFMPSFIEKLGEIESRYSGIMITNCGHAADGNLHSTIHRMPGLSAAEWGEKLEQVKGEIYQEMQVLGGKITGEHGIGSKRVKDFLGVAKASELELLRTVKKSWDPNGILNPGTILPIDFEEARPEAK